MRKTIAFDLDDTLTCNVEKLIDHYNRESGDNLTFDKITAWHLEDFVLPDWKDKIPLFFRRPGWFRDIKPREDMQQAIRILSKTNDIIVVTAFYPTVCSDKADYIKEFYPEIDVLDINFVNRKGRILCDYLVDDGAHNLEDTTAIPICMRKPWNEAYYQKAKADGKTIYGIRDGNELLDLFYNVGI